MVQVGDHVLGRVRSMNGAHMSDSRACDYYVPATICVLLLEQQKHQSLLLNQQELLMGLQEGHKELMEKVQHKDDTDNYSSQ